ncbi:hypothetical protein C2R22_06000 [Salinigranum rubrum]|uniref:Uncharacterized protein n=1 Tax=Salinigranum rubrum TaxID=755307 RepID=A0A2I8VH71_9EURY|nr:hypothetical protein [Salinigranum rubrum]AUV81271.1 hypothetical protein C2R22_06000 [Salinigranum rubrum]
MSNETCGDYGGTNREGDPCGAPAGRGTDFADGKCKHHRGTNADGSSHEENQNATTHGLTAKKVNAFYQNVLDADVQALVDDIFDDYLEKYKRLHGEPTTGDAAELFRIAVSYGKHVHAEHWSIEKPDPLDSGHPMVDRETKVSESGREYHTYKETVVAKGQARLSRDRRAWLKDLGLLDDPQSQTADVLSNMKEAWISSAKNKQ